MIEMGDKQPAGFRFFTGLCLFLGGIGLLGTIIFLIIGISHGLSPNMKEKVFWLSALHLVRDAGYIYGAVKVNKRINLGRQIILTCATTSLLALFYNTSMSLSKGEIQPSLMTIVYFLVPLFLEGSIVIYFSRKAVRDFVANRSE